MNSNKQKMISPEESVLKAIEVADEALEAGEMPIGAAVYSGNKLIATAFTKEMLLKRRIVHADLLAMLEADKIIGFDKSYQPLTLAVNLEPCAMCLGAAITLGIQNVYYALESPNDGAHKLIESWDPPQMQDYFKAPDVIKGGFHRQQAIDQFAWYAEGDGPAGMREWARSLAVQ